MKTRKVLHLQTSRLSIFALLLVVAIGGVSVHLAQSQYDDRDKELGVKNTLLIYPGAVLDTAWSGVEHVLSPDLYEDSLFQDFSARNSAYVPLFETVSDEAAPVSSSEETQDVPPTVVPTEDTSTTSSETGVSEELPTAPASSEEGGTEVAPAETSSEASETIAPEEPVIEEQTQEPETSSEPVTLKKATVSFFTFLGTVTELFPFMNTQAQESVQTPEASDDVASQEPVTEEILVDDVPAAEPEEELEVVTQEEEVEIPSSSIVPPEVSTSSASTTQTLEDVEGVEEPLPTAEPVAYDMERTITLSDFSTPPLARGEFITGMQLRMSLAASYDYDPSSSTPAPVLEISYKTPSSTERVGTVIIDQEISNAINGGYFLFALPQVLSTTQLDDVSIEITYKGDAENLAGVYLDAAWLEIDVERLDKQLLQERLLRDMLKRLGNPELATLLSESKDFTREEIPQFSLKYNSQRNIAIRFFRDLFGHKLAEIEEVAFVHNDVGDIGISPQVDMTNDGLLNIQLDEEDKSKMRPGEYTVELTINEGGVLYTDTFTFQWGLLSINPHQTAYALGDTVEISMGALSPNGNTICDADLSLYVIDPEETLFRVPVASSGVCNGNNVIDVADYSALFVPASVGEYEMYLERVDIDGTIVAHTIDTFKVEEALPFVLKRDGPSRVYPRALYPMEISVTAAEAWEGTLVEKVPAEFVISDTSANITNKGDHQELSWDITLASGETQTFSYVFDTPDISPYLYTVGSASLVGSVPEEDKENATSTASSTPTTPTAEDEPQVIPEDEESTADEQLKGEVDVPVPEEAQTQVPQEQPEVPSAEPLVSDESSDLSTEDPMWTEPGMLQEPLPMDSVAASEAFGNIVFEEHREWQIASDATGSMIVYWNSAAAIPAGWTCLSCGSGTFYQRFPMGGASYNTTGGAATHTHTASGVVNSSATVNTENNGSGEISIPTHTHLYTPTISTVSSLPAYRQFRVIQRNSAGDTGTIPAGAIMVFDTASLPTGWTRLAALDGRYLRGENSIANGGSNTHTHTITGNTTAATNISTLNSRTGGTQVNGAAAAHTHSVSSNTASQNNEPPFIEVVFATAAVATTTPVGSIAMWSDEPPAQWIDHSSSPTDPFNGRFLKGATSYGTTGGALNHTPADVLGITSGAPSVLDNARTGSSGNSNTHTHAVDVSNFSTASHLPPYLTVVFGKKLGAVPLYTQTKYRIYANENVLTPTDPWPVGGSDLLENEPITEEHTAVKNGDVIRLRMQLGVTNSTSTAESFKLQFATTTAVCSDASLWTDVGNATSSVVWRGYDNAGVADGATLASSTLSGTHTFGSYEETNPSVAMPNLVGTDKNGEWDFVVQQNSAEANTTYCFRMVENDGTPLLNYIQYPSVVTNMAPEPPTLSKLFDNEKVGITTPHFEFFTSDKESNDVTYQIQVSDDYAFLTPIIDRNTVTHSTQFENRATPSDKDPFTNGELIRFLNSTPLNNGTTYYWRVRALDPSGSNRWGQWATIRSFTIDTSVTVSTWFQTTQEQFNSNILEGVEAVASDQAQLRVGSTTGLMYSDPVKFEEGELGSAWGEFSFADTETASDLKYTIQHLFNDVWTDIPDTALPGNATGFDTSPVSLLGIDKTEYPEIRIKASFTNSGASPSLQSWTVKWDYRIETPAIATPFASEKVATTTPTFEFSAIDPQNDDLVYQLQWSTTYAFAASTTRSSNLNAGFTNIDNGIDTSPFVSGDSIRYKIQASDALTNGVTYWWRVRARDPLGANTYSFYTDARSFTVDTSVTVSTWFQTTQSQFEADILSGVVTSGDAATVSTLTDESLVAYAEGTVTTPRYREWNGTVWSGEQSALDVGATINWIVTKAAPNENEYILGTLGTDGDVNVQVYSNGAWGHLEEVTTSASNVDMRAFDIAYETNSGDALAVACDGDADPSYHIWNGSSWTDGGDINLTNTNACAWVRLISDPTSDEIIVITRDITGVDYEAMVWNGSSWGNSAVWGGMTDVNNEGIAAAYEWSGGQAVVAVSNTTAANFTWRAWNGSSWTAAATVTLGDDFEWGTLVADDGTDNMALCYVDEDSDLGVVRWTGSAWTGQIEHDTAGNSKTERAVDCVYEKGGARDGYLMFAYSDTTAVRYRTWNGSTWTGEASVSTITDSSTLQLRRTGDNLLQLMAYDDVSDRYDYSSWNGTTWSTREALETNASVGAVPFKEPFMIAPRNPSVFGTLIANPPLVFSEGSGPYWQQMSWNDTESGGSSILYQLEYYDGDSWELIPNSLIPNNSTGNGTSPINLTNVLPAATYGQIRPVANMICNLGTCPTLSDWTITWAAGINISGTAQQYDQSTNLTTGTVAVAVNGILQAGKTGIIAGGAWSIANVNAAPGDVITVFLTGAADSAEAVVVTTYDGVGDITGVNLFQRHLTIGSDDAATVSNAALSLFDFTKTEDVFFDVNGSNDLTICATTGCADAKLYIKAGNTYQPGAGGDSTIFDLENNGTLILNGNTMRVAGSWKNNATTSMATSSVIFTALTSDAIPEPWYNSSWLYRVPITINASEVPSNVTNFPVYVDLSDLGSAFFDEVTSDGGDIRVTTGDGITELAREIVSIDTVADTGEIYFKADSISSVTNTTFYIYYDNAVANDYAVNATYGRQAVWNNGYVSVYHLNESPTASAPQYVDSTGNSAGTAISMEIADRVTGVAGNAAGVDGTNEHIETNLNQSVLGSTWSLFLNASGVQGACDGTMFSRGTGVNGMNVGACGDVNRIGYHWENAAATSWNWAGGPTYPTNQWFMATLAVESTRATVYAHTAGGVTSGSNITPHTLSTIDNLDLGWDSYGVARSFQGSMDEARLSNVTRSADWLSAEYNNLSDTGAFYGAGSPLSYASSTGTINSYVLEDASGELDFYNLTFGEGSGNAQWSILDSLDVDNTLTVAHGTLSRNTQAVFVAGNLTTSVNGAWTGMGTTTFDGVAASTLTDSTAGLQNIGNVVVDGSTKVLRLGSNAKMQSLTVGANDTFDLSPSNYDVTVYGSWINNNAFNARNGDVVFAGTTAGQVITVGGDNFYNVLFTGAGGSWSFTESTLGISNDFAITAGTVTLPTATTTIAGSFTNSGGTFVHNNGSMRFTSGSAEVVTLQGTAFTNALYNASFSGSGSWTFTDVNATTSNQFRITQGTVTLPSGTLTIGDTFTNSGGTFAHNNGTIRFVSGATKIIDTNASFFNLTFAGSGSYSFLDTSVTVLGSISVNSGALTLPSNILTLSGSLYNSGSIAHNNGTVLFNSNDAGEIVSLGSSPLFNMTFNHASGGWTVNAHATTTNNTTLTAAGSFTLASGQRLSVGGVFTNNATASSTTWTGSVLALEAGNYSINAKASAGDTYGTVAINNAEAKMWNSSATSYIVQGTGSLYSQDHAGVNGDLYIFGSYERTSGTEHWSYATDFDGTSLAGGAERQARVAFASGAGAAFSGDALHILGAAHATTTVTNQGSGTYSLAVTSGAVHADRYLIRNTNASGFAFSGTPSIVSLNNGQYELGAAGSSITVSGSAIDANPALQIFDVHFDSTTSTSSPWLTGWNYRKSHTIGSATGAGTDYQVMLKVHYGSGTDTADTVYLNGNGKTDFSDLRFTASDGVTLLPYWIESQTNGDQAAVWVKVADNLSSSGSTLQVYYGNASASSTSDGEATFLFFDDFSGASLNTSKWQTYNVNSHAQSGGVLTATTTNLDPAKIIAYENGSGETGNNIAFRARFRPRVGTGTDQRAGLSIKTSIANGQGYNYLLHNFSSRTPRAFLDDLVAWGPTHTEAWSQTAWYTEEISHDGTNVRGRFDDGAWYTWARTGRTGYFALNIGGLGGLVSNDWDFALARKIVVTEPVHGAWGSEESSIAYTQYNVTQNGATPASYWWFRNSSGDFDGEALDNDTGNPGSIRWDDSSLVLSVSGTVYADDGVTPLTGGTCNGVSTPVRVVVSGGASYTGSCSASDGSYTVNGVNIIGDPILTVYLDGASGGQKAVAVTKTPTGNITGLDLYANRVITRHEDSAPMTIADMAVYDATDDADILFFATTSPYASLTVGANAGLTVWPSKTFTPGGSVTLQGGGTGDPYDGSLHIGTNATFTGSGTTTYSVGGTFSVAAGGAFVAADSTVLMTATTAGKAITAQSGQTIGFNTLRFTGVGGGWNLNGNIEARTALEIATGTVTGTGNITVTEGPLYGNGLLSLGGGTTTLARTNTLGGTQGWTFYDLILGNGVTVGTTTPASNATTTIAGRLTIASGHYLDAGAAQFDLSGTGTVFVENGSFLEGTSTVRYSGATGATILSTRYYNLHLDAAMGTPVFTPAGLGIVVANDLTIGGEGTTSVNFNTNDTALDVNGNVTIAPNGTLIGSNTGVFTVEGNWDNNGVFTHSNGTVTFDGSGSSMIAGGSSPFGSVILNGLGNFTVSENTITDAAFTLTSIGSFTLASGQTLEVKGVFNNAVGGSATTWLGSTLKLSSGTHYQINAKSVSDAYETLAIGGNTDIRMWNSSASAYEIDVSSSLYSQDHASVDGDLYIFGNYQGNGTTDHWSYATDFDGTSLAGGNERQANVYFDDESQTVETFTAGGTFIPPAGVTEVDVLVVAGGGGGGTATAFANAGAGGGGGGGVVYEEAYSVVPLSPVTVTVGNGGAAGASGNNPGVNGGNSSFGSLTALGGGGGMGGNAAGLNGGSGGGARGGNGGSATQPGSSSGGFGNRGGNMPGSAAGAGATGGGGAGGAAEDLAGTAGEKGGNGGAGLAFNLNGTPVYYGAGGGGGAAQAVTPVGTGGIGGGGNGGNNGTAATAGTAHTGSGGGGGNNNQVGKAGGSGIVIVRYEGGASATYANGGLSVRGVGLASTSIQSAGSAPFALQITGTASTTWSYYDIEDMQSSGIVFSGTPQVTTLSHGSFTVSQAGGSALTVGGSVIDANPAKTFTGNTFSTTTGIVGTNVTATGASISSWRFTNHSGSIAGEQYDADPNGDPGYIVWDNSSANITVSGNVYSDEGTTVSGVCNGTTQNIVVRVAGLTTYTSSCHPTTGLFSVSGVTFSPGDSIIAYIDGQTQKGATVTEDPVSNISNLHIYENRVIVRHENTDPLSIADMAVWDSSDDADIPFTAVDSSTDTLTLPANRKLLVWTGKTFEPGGNITITGAGAGAPYDGTFEAQANAAVNFSGTQTHSVGGSFILGTGATFTAGLSTTTFTTTGAGRTIDVNNSSFYNVAFTGSGSWTIADSVFDVQNFTKTNGALTFPTGTTTVSGSFSNTGGTFAINGSTIVFDATTAGKIVRAGGSHFEELIFSGVGGSWSMTDTHATSTGSVTVQSGSVSLPSGSFAVGGNFRNVGGTITHNTSDLYLTSATGATLRARGSDLFTVAFNGAGNFTMEDQNLALLDDLRIMQGSVTFATGTISIGGSLTANGGTFNNASGTVLFNSTDAGEVVQPGTSPFYNAVFANPAGGWSVSSATTTNNFTLSNAASYTQVNGSRLYVGKVFTNNVGGSATTWTGSTLVLNAGSPYAINTKTTGDQYATLVVGNNTDIKSWNSSATSPIVSASGSLYSQDHGGSNGALSIYGDFHVSTTTEYWSYATDFDGTSLAGTERAVTVSIAANATTTVDGGTLHIVGASGNPTNITNQGSGTYAFKVKGGTFNALVYAYRNLDASGLHFTGSPTISSLSQGDYELAVNGGNLITLASSTLNANASKLFSGNRFATTSAITGTNIELLGETANAWTFVSYTGNLAGENFDEDGISACGSIRWNNSACLLTQQTHYRWRHDDGSVGVPDSEWYSSSWGARKSVRLHNQDAASYAHAVVKLRVEYDADMQIDFDDLRFTDQSGTTSIPYFIERYTPSVGADVWVEVPVLAGEDMTTLFMYFDNAAVTTTSSADDTFIVADDFEDGNISEYSGETSLFTVDGSFAYGGSYGLDATGDETSRADYGIAQTGATVSQGQIIRYMQFINTTTGSGDEVCTLFAVQSPVSSSLNYAVCLEQVTGTDRISLSRDVDDVDTSGTILASTSVAYTTGWYEVEVDWQTNDLITVTLKKDNVLVATISDTDGTYSSGGIGFTYWFQHGGWDNYTSRARVETEPTVYFGERQSDGGASWASGLDNIASYTTNDIARLRLAIENSGLEITDQTFDLEFAIKGSAPSCEAVSSADYARVPVQSTCGSSPLCMQSSSYVTNNQDIADLLFGTNGQYVAGKAVEDPSNSTQALTIGQNEYIELEYAVTPTVHANEPAYCLRVTDDGDALDTYLSVAELSLKFAPTVTNVTLNGGIDISLLPGATTTVYAEGTVSDLNGYTDLAYATSTIYRSGVALGAACAADANNCYISTAPLCSFTSCMGNSCQVMCSADIYFHADATDVAPYEGEQWLASIEISDQSGSIDMGTVPMGVELTSLRALDVTSSINYGALEVAATTGSYNPTTTVQNLGNVPIDIQLEGTDLTDGGSSFIPTSEQKFATSTFTYTGCPACSALSSTTPVALDVDLTKPTSAGSPVTDIVYWGIEIPYGVASNPHSGTNIFYAVSDSL